MRVGRQEHRRAGNQTKQVAPDADFILQGNPVMGRAGEARLVLPVVFANNFQKLAFLRMLFFTN